MQVPRGPRSATAWPGLATSAGRGSRRDRGAGRTRQPRAASARARSIPPSGGYSGSHHCFGPSAGPGAVRPGVREAEAVAEGDPCRAYSACPAHRTSGPHSASGCVRSPSGRARKEASCRSPGHSRAALGAVTPGRSRGTTTRSARGCMVQRTGVASKTVSPSMPTGIWGIGGDGDLIGGAHGQSPAVPTAHQPGAPDGRSSPGRRPPQGQRAAGTPAPATSHLIGCC